METRVCPAIERRPMEIRLARGQEVACLLELGTRAPTWWSGQQSEFEASFNASGYKGIHHALERNCPEFPDFHAAD